MRIQLWSYNYDPEPTGIGPVSRTLAEGLQALGHEVRVVAAHPHYPEAAWGTRVRPYRERRNGIPVIRLPLWIGRDTAAQRIRQELSFMLAQGLAAPLLDAPDVLISASPSFPALLPAVINARSRKLQWVLWLHDILPDGATATGLVQDGYVVAAARWLERAAYARADRIVVLSQSFTQNLTAKGVPRDKIRLIYDSATRTPKTEPRFGSPRGRPLRVISMGNIGYSQGLAPLVAAFERSGELKDVPIELIITGGGVASDEVAAEINSPRVKMLGLVSDDRLEEELQSADIALVSQLYDGPEFNIPSKLMNFMAYGLPIVASVNPSGEVARIVTEANAGWVVSTSKADDFPSKLAQLAREPEQIAPSGRAALSFARLHFSTDGFSESFDRELRALAASTA
jgi:colanic acid biosynthesis glycosyl transferase WcaI